jgi:hypothetical protein
MFDQIVRGLKRCGLRSRDISYFELHQEQDQDHGAWLEEALVLYATTEQAQEQIYRGAMLSLRARAKLWSGMQDKIVRWRQPANMHLRTDSRGSKYDQAGEMTFAAWKKMNSA